MFYVCRLLTMDLSRRHGPESEDHANGRYDVDIVPCTAESLAPLHLIPETLAAYLRDHAHDVLSLVP